MLLNTSFDKRQRAQESNNIGRRCWLALVMAGLVMPVTINAQVQLEEIIVTARKRAESLQDVPLAVTTITSADLERMAAVSLKDLKHIVPSLHYSDRSALQTEITIRGVGGNARSIGIESGVGLYVDGVFAGRTNAYNLDLANIEQIEVLRGPQGTLFGKNTTGGALNIVTRKPTEEFEGSASLGFGNYGAIRLKGSLAGALSDNVFARLTVATWDRDGYLHNLFDGSELQTQERRAARLQLTFLPSENVEINFSADMTTDDQDTILMQLGSGAAYGCPSPCVDLTPFFNNDRFVVNTNQPNTTKRDLQGYSLTIDYTLKSGSTLTSITAFRDSEIILFSDIDQTPLDIDRSGPFTDNSEQFTQELRLASPGEDTVNYVVGLYYYKQDAEAHREIYTGPGLLLAQTDGPVDTEALAAFANVDFNITDQFTLTAGVRVTDEEKTGSYTQVTGLPVPSFNKSFPNLKTSSTETSWTVAANYKWSNDVSTYLSASRGFKSGGFNVDPLITPAALTADELTFKPEFVTTYEVGLKADLLDSRMRIGAAVFITDYVDRQVSVWESIGGFASILQRNAGKSEITGAELEFKYAASEKLTLYGALSVLDGEYVEFTNATAAGDDFSGNATEKTPYSNIFIGADYRAPVGNGELVIAPQFARVGKTYLQPDNGPFNVENGYSVWNLRVGYEYGNGRYGIYLWGKNLGDEDYKEFARQFRGSDQVLWGEPKTYGVTFTVNF